MEDTSRGIVQELLTKDNYERWKILMRNYLRGKDLWAVVERGFNSTNVNDSMKDAEALHIIQLSCGSKIFDEIKHFETAKDTWNSLASHYGFESIAEPDIEQGKGDDNLVCFKELYRDVERGNWKGVESFIRRNRGALYFASESDKRTVLHVATMAGDEEVVDVLVKEGGERLLKMQDEQGYTALALAADLTGNVAVAKCLVKDCENLLAIKNNKGETPLLLAAHKGHKDMTRYLFRIYKKEHIEQDFCNLLKLCIEGEILDVALKLLKSYLNLDQLPTESLSDVVRAMNPLAKMPSAFLSGCQFGLGQKFIYYILRVGKKFQHNVGRRHETNFPVLRVQEKFQNNDEGRHKTNFSGWFCGSIMKFLHLLGKVLGWFCRPIMDRLPILCVIRFLGFCTLFMDCLYLPVKVLGEKLDNVLIQFLTGLNIFGSREIYELKCTHSQVQNILWYMQDIVERLNFSQLQKASVYNTMLDAAKHGIIEFINAMTGGNQDLSRARDNHKRGIFSYAILHRKQKVFQLIYNLNGRKDIIKYQTDVFNNNLLHLAAQLGPSSDLHDRAGAALQMQRELQWFKAVEEVVGPKCKTARNDDGKMPRELFTETHKELVKEGEKWAKQQAKSFALVGILITTIMFAGAFTVPGGNNQVTGVPIFLNNSLLTTFLIADAISLFTSATSVLLFIWILTSRFAEEDFLNRLPWKLLFGLIFLFLSVASMMTAFCAALSIVLKNYWAYKQLVVVGVILGIMPVFVLVRSQVMLIYEILLYTLSNPIRRGSN